MARILVPGGAGYIGSHVVRALVAANHDVTVLDNLSTGFREAVDPKADFIRCDLADGTRVREIVSRGFDAAAHFAASIVVPESVEDPLKYYQNNTVNTTGLIAALVDHDVHNMIFSSTAAVYGMPPGGVAQEDQPTAPINPYGRSKLMSEWVLEDTSKASDLRYVALRYFNVAGASLDNRIGQRTRGATHLVKVAAQAALGRRDALTIYGTDYDTPDGTGVRDYIHVEDLANAHVVALHHLLDGGRSEILNCGYGHGASVREVLSTMRAVSGVHFPISEGPRRAGDPGTLIADASRIGQRLGWKPQHDDLELICRTALAWERSLG